MFFIVLEEILVFGILFYFEIFNIFTNNIIRVKASKVLQYL